MCVCVMDCLFVVVDSYVVCILLLIITKNMYNNNNTTNNVDHASFSLWPVRGAYTVRQGVCVCVCDGLFVVADSYVVRTYIIINNHK